MNALRLSLALSLFCIPAAFADTAPCSLLSQSQVNSATGASVGAGSPIANTGCSWTSASPKITVTVSTQSEKMYNAAKSGSMPNQTKKQVSGIGDEAVYVGVEGFSSLWIKKGSKYLLVRVYGLPVDQAQPKLKSLAAEAVSKL